MKHKPEGDDETDEVEDSDEGDMDKSFMTAAQSPERKPKLENPLSSSLIY